MGSNDSKTEGLRGLICGVAYGLASPLVGCVPTGLQQHSIYDVHHAPISACTDTPSTLSRQRFVYFDLMCLLSLSCLLMQMQAESAFSRSSAWGTMRQVVQKQGFLALYKGLLPPLAGSVVFRSIQFSTYIGTYVALEDSDLLTRPISVMGGLQARVVLAGLTAASVRTIIETPLEHIKVRRQTGQAWRKYSTVAESLRHPLLELLHAYGGVGITWARTAVLMTSFFVMVDSIVRWAPEVFTYPVLGPFAKGGVCATIAWGACFPLEVAKSRVQASAMPTTWRKELHTVVSEQGVMGLYRGFGPGAARSIFANGTSMMVFAYCQSCFAAMDALK